MDNVKILEVKQSIFASNDEQAAQLRQSLQQSPGVGVPCVVEDLFHGAVLDDLARVHNGHAVGHVCHNAQVMGDVDNGHAQLLLQVADQLQDLCLNGHVQCSGRLVADQDLRAAGRCNGDDDTLAHTAGELVRVLFVTAPATPSKWSL